MHPGSGGVPVKVIAINRLTVTNTINHLSKVVNTFEKAHFYFSLIKQKEKKFSVATFL